jgi:hypothetical protein
VLQPVPGFYFYRAWTDLFPILNLSAFGKYQSGLLTERALPD